MERHKHEKPGANSRTQQFIQPLASYCKQLSSVILYSTTKPKLLHYDCNMYTKHLVVKLTPSYEMIFTRIQVMEKRKLSHLICA